MEVLSQIRTSFRGRSSRPNNSRVTHSYHHNQCDDSIDSNNNDSVHFKKRTNFCDLCGKRFLKLAKWRNYFRLPCKCRHVFCKQCITGRLQCRQKVLRSASFDLMWTFPCPGSAQCGQELTVDWSRGSSYSKNLVARDLGSGDNSSFFWEQEEEEDRISTYSSDNDNSIDPIDISGCSDDVSTLREIG